MEYEPYPKWLYHADGRVVLVRNDAEHDGYRDWLESPPHWPHGSGLPVSTVEEDVRKPKKDQK